MNIKKLTTQQLIKIFAGELLKLNQHPKYRKNIEEVERKSHNKEIIDRLKREKGLEQNSDDDDFDLSPGWQERSVKEKVKNIKNVIDLGRGDFGYDRSEDPYFLISLDYWDDIESQKLENNTTKALKLAEEYQKEHSDMEGLYECLKYVFENEGPSLMEYHTVQFYLLPAKEFHKVNVGPGAYMLEPDERDIEEKLDRLELDYYTINIFSNNVKKYTKMVDEFLKQSESGKYTA